MRLPSLHALSLNPQVLSTDALLDGILEQREKLVAALNEHRQKRTEPSDSNAQQSRKRSALADQARHVKGEAQRNRRLCPNPDCDKGVDEVKMDTEDQAVCDACGTELQPFASQDSSIRNLPDEDQAARMERLHAETYDAEEVHRLYTIELSEISPVETPEILNAANARLRQSSFLLQRLGDNAYTHDGGFWLTDAEIRTATTWLRAACTQWAKAGGNARFKGSPSFWTIVLALQSVARRENGSAVKKEQLQAVVTMDGLHDLLGKFVGNREKAAESENASTLAGSSHGWARKAQQITEKNVFRLPRLDSLGDPTERAGKMNVLNKLLIDSGSVRLTTQVRTFQAPGLIKQYEGEF